MNFTSLEHEAKFKKASKKVRELRQSMINNLDSSFNVIDAKLDAQIEKDLARALNKLKKLTPNPQCTKSDMFLSAYA